MTQSGNALGAEAPPSPTASSAIELIAAATTRRQSRLGMAEIIWSPNLHSPFVPEGRTLNLITGQQPQAPVAERVASRSRLQIAEGAMGSSRSISSHCDSKTLAAINLAFEGAWNVLETRDLLARFANNCELQAELGQRLVVLSDLPKGSNSMRAILHANFTDDVATLSCTSDSSTRDPQLRDSSVDGFEAALTSARDAWQAKGSSSSRSARTTTYSARVVRHR
jgi:hypothetical protein